MATVTPLETILRRDRAVILGALGVVVLASWAYLLAGAGTGMSAWGMSSLDLALGRVEPMPIGEVSAGATSGGPVNAGETSGDPMSCIMGDAMSAMATPARWSLEYAGIMVSMWWVMMIAMMVPSAAPAILVYARVVLHAQMQGHSATAVVPVAWFVAGYLAAWLGFSVAAVLVQWGLERLGLVHMMMMWSLDLSLSGAILVAVGLYQLSPFKQRCLSHCRMPAEYLARHWRPGIGGALRLGAAHGLYCLGCCVMLMALLLVGGIMNLFWIAGIALLVLAEKLVPGGRHLARITGAALLAGGVYVLAAA